jgi:hypothetical protein
MNDEKLIDEILADYRQTLTQQMGLIMSGKHRLDIKTADGMLADKPKQALLQMLKEARLNERKEVALDNYRGHTFSENTNYEGRFQKFITNNEKRISQLTQDTNTSKEKT